jgi:hypothetical protein
MRIPYTQSINISYCCPGLSSQPSSNASNKSVPYHLANDQDSASIKVLMISHGIFSQKELFTEPFNRSSMEIALSFWDKKQSGTVSIRY